MHHQISLFLLLDIRGAIPVIPRQHLHNHLLFDFFYCLPLPFACNLFISTMTALISQHTYPTYFVGANASSSGVHIAHPYVPNTFRLFLKLSPKVGCSSASWRRICCDAINAPGASASLASFLSLPGADDADGQAVACIQTILLSWQVLTLRRGYYDDPSSVNVHRSINRVTYTGTPT